METLLGSLLGFLMGLAQQWMQSRQPAPVPAPAPSAPVAVEGEVDVESCVSGNDSPFEALEPPFRHRVLDFMRGMIRPGLTLGFFLAWLSVKAAILFFALHQAEAVSLPAIFWNEDDAVLLATVTTFWFGSRLYSSRTRK